MMIDQVTLAGASAYLRRADGTVRLGSGEDGVSVPVVRGEAIEVTAIDLYLEVDHALDMFARTDAPLLTFTLRKEVFPSFFLDPHAHRVHQIASYEDFGRAEHSSMTVMEIDGVPTLVSPGQIRGCEWHSARYRLPRPTILDGVAWTLAPSRGTPVDSWRYAVQLRHWPPGDELLRDSDASLVDLTNGQRQPGQLRHHELASHVEIGGYQICFSAEVDFDTALLERHGNIEQQSVGTPLLQAVFLVEELEPLYAVHSMQELLMHSGSYHLLDQVEPVRRLTARVHFPALLTEGESITINVASARIKRCEARLDATVRQRPVEPVERSD